MTLNDTYTPDNLIASDFPLETDRETLLSGQDLERGALLGKITVGGKLTQCDSSNGDGSEEPYAILVSDSDASLADLAIDVYKSGGFNGEAIGVVTGDDIDDFKDALRDISIFIKTTQGA